jgi:hypothetical protein
VSARRTRSTAALRCDVPGCANRRARGHRLCQRCFDLLPAIVSRGLNIAFRNGDRSLWRARKVEAGRILAAASRAVMKPRSCGKTDQRASPATLEAYQRRTAAMLGERPDA